MKAVIPVAGVGTKLRPHTHTQPKPMIPVAGKPILGHIIENLLATGIRKQVFIIGYLGDKIRDYVVSTYKDQIEAEFVVQEPRKGLAHALWVAKETIADADEILVVLGDTIFVESPQEMLQMEGTVLGVQEVDRPREFGILMVNEVGQVSKLVEKPDIPMSNLAMVGLYKISNLPLLWEVLTTMLGGGLEEGKEYSLTDALMNMIEAGHEIKPYLVENWYDCGRTETLLRTNQILLNRLPAQAYQEEQFEEVVIIPPVYIEKNCIIKHSIIGPNVALGDHAHISNSIVSNSILGAFSSLDSIILRNSVVGNDTSLKGKSHQINIGDNTEIDLGQ
ncbi:MAG: sugar phosphate nucleotidyltransferase [Bacteroidota bacterium]